MRYFNGVIYMEMIKSTCFINSLGSLQLLIKSCLFNSIFYSKLNKRSLKILNLRWDQSKI